MIALIIMILDRLCFLTKTILIISLFPVFGCNAELIPVSDVELHNISGQSGITLNAKVIFGDESSFVFANTSGKKKADATSAETSYLIVDNIQGELEIEGLALDLISDLKNSGKAAFQWTLPKKIKTKNLKTTGIYASSTENVDSASTFLLGVELHGELSFPANTKISLFVVD